MCGIVGAFGNLSESTLENMTQKMAHRGPDYMSFTSFGNVHLGHTRLKIIDLSSNSNQPLWDTSHKACIVFNGEIYNYQILKKDLIEKSYEFNSEGDAEVLLNLYLEYGLHLFDKLNGIFSFAIWDNDRQRLVIARDPYGVKPLYYAQDDNGFYFASEIKSILAANAINKDINFNALLRTLVFLWSPGEETLFTQIKKLKPAHYAIIEDNKMVEYKCYWEWPEYQPSEESQSILIQKIFDALEATVQEQLIADVPVGTFLSGGLDSSFITALAKLNSATEIISFTINPTQSKKDYDDFTADLPYSKQVAQILDVELNILETAPDIITMLPKMIYHLDELQADPAPINILLICELARQKGIKVLLSGAGGDDIFTGYRRHFAAKLEKYWTWLPIQPRKFLKNLTSLLPIRYPLFRRISKAFHYADCSENERLLSYYFWLDPIIALDLFNPHIQDQISKSPMKFLLDELNQFKTSDPIEKMLHLERKYFLVDHNLNYTDKMSMANGVEVRVPFLDKRVIDTAAKIPSSLKLKGRTGKWILKKAAEKILPKKIIYRSKTGFGAPLRDWLKNELSPLVEQYLSVDMLNKRNIFNPEKVHSLIEMDKKGKCDYSYPIFALLCFEIWCQQFLE